MAFDQTKELESMDIAWLQENGWTVSSNLAYRHILHDFVQTRSISAERIEQILMQYDALAYKDKITGALQELIQLKKDLGGL